MKHISTIAKAAALISLSTVCGIAAAATQNLAVTATISKQCSFSSTATTMSFGAAIDPSSAGPISGTLTVPITYKCTKGVKPGTFSVDAGLYANNMKDTVSGDLIPYTLLLGAAVAGTGFGSGQDISFPLTGSITAAGYANVSAGTYNDTVVLTVAP
jgi:spore coat protein U-like protein